MDRRALFALTGAAAVAGLAAPKVLAADPGLSPGLSKLDTALARFRRLPGRTAYKLRVSPPGRPWETSHQADRPLFVGSAIKTFINLKFLQDVEEGRLSEDTEEAVDDGVRSLGSPVYLHLTGTTPARSVLEAMITHSDNTATDIALKTVRPNRVRDFLASAGFRSAKIPTSTRMMFSYLSGAALGVDVGWKGMLEIEAGKRFGPERSPMNDRETMQCSASDFVIYYERALTGRYFKKPETLTEFKRIQAMAGVLPLIVPPDTPAYAKGGSIETDALNCLCVPGQMRLGGSVPVTFCFTVNWAGASSTVPTVTEDFLAIVRDALHEAVQAFG